jgi:hypothetical protein
VLLFCPQAWGAVGWRVGRSARSVGAIAPTPRGAAALESVRISLTRSDRRSNLSCSLDLSQDLVVHVDAQPGRDPRGDSSRVGNQSAAESSGLLIAFHRQDHGVAAAGAARSLSFVYLLFDSPAACQGITHVLYGVVLRGHGARGLSELQFRGDTGDAASSTRS